MKKIFAWMLAAMMLISCFAIGVVADEADRVIITDGSDLAGWVGESSSGIPEPVLDETLDDYPVVAFTYTGQIYNEGGYNHPEGTNHKPTNGVKIHYKAVATETKAHDLTGMKYMIFDLYVSDPAKVEGVNFWLELTSVGKPDTEEINWKQPLSAYVGGEVVAGWNHIELDLSTGKLGSKDDGLNMANWNFMRIFNSQGFDAGEGFTLAFKNVYFSTRAPKAEAAAEAEKAAAEAAKAAAEAITALYAPIADISTGDITAENYETVKAQLAAALEAFNAAESSVQLAVEEAYDVGKIERSVTRALEKYEDSLNTPAEPDTPTEPDPVEPDAPVEPDTTDEPDTPDEPTTPDEPDEPANEVGLSPVVIAVIAVAVIAVIVVIVLVAKKKKK